MNGYDFDFLIVISSTAPGPKKQGESPEGQDSVSLTSQTGLTSQVSKQHVIYVIL